MKEGVEAEGQQEPAPPILEAVVDRRLCYSLTFYHQGEPVGRAQLHCHGDDAIDIVDLYVDPQQRGRGWGMAIVRHCLFMARSIGAHTVTAHTSPDNLPAYRLFLSLGFRARHEEHHLELQLE